MMSVSLLSTSGTIWLSTARLRMQGWQNNLLRNCREDIIPHHDAVVEKHSLLLHTICVKPL